MGHSVPTTCCHITSHPKLNGLKQQQSSVLLTNLQFRLCSLGTAHLYSKVLSVREAYGLGLESSGPSLGQLMPAVRWTLSWECWLGQLYVPLHVAAWPPHGMVARFPEAASQETGSKSCQLLKAWAQNLARALCPLYSISVPGPTFKDGDIIPSPDWKSVQEFWTEEALEEGQGWGEIMNLYLMEKKGKRPSLSARHGLSCLRVLAQSLAWNAPASRSAPSHLLPHLPVWDSMWTLELDH